MVVVRARPQDVVCPVAALLKYLENRPDPKHVHEQLYVHLNGAPLREQEIRSFLAKARAILGWCREIMPHSFRMGRATELFVKGKPIHYIIKKGRWRSNAVLQYIQPY